MPPEGRTSQRTILLVEDSESLRYAMRRFLEQHNFRIIDAVDGAEAWILARDHFVTVDLVVTDYRMPRMDGLELLERLNVEHPGLPVLFAAGVGVDELLESHSELLIIRKPFELDALLKKITEILLSTPPGQMPPFAPSSDESARQISSCKYLDRDEWHLSVKAEISAALAMVKAGESALATSDLRTAEHLNDAAQRSCTAILQQIGASTEDDADSVEAVFTEFEEKLMALARSIGWHPRVD